MAEREQVVLNGRYELHRRVGRGGMAVIATHLPLGLAAQRDLALSPLRFAA